MKKITSILLAAIVSCMLIVPAASAFYYESDKPEIIVDVYVNKYDEEYILNTELDDGTKVSDYNYVIYYHNNPSTRAYETVESYFDYVAWLSRDDGMTLSLDPNNSVRNDAALRDPAWEVLVDSWYGAGGNPYWSNEEGMHDQYNCHFEYAKMKDRWNLEPWRPVVSWAQMILSACNPE